MAERTCPLCGDPVLRTHALAVYCTDRCTERAHAIRRHTSEQRCRWCDSVLPRKGRAGPKRYCSSECKALAVMPASSPVPWAECDKCERWFVARNGRRYCPAPRCQHRTYWHQDRAECSACGEPRRKWKKLCDKCRDERYAEHLARFIEYRERTRPAAKAADRARRRGARTTERIDPAEVYARDGYRCQICGKRLAMKQAWPHPRSPTLDHIVPVSRGGMHERANVQAAHMMCNSRKGAGGTDQLRLIG